MPLSYGKNRCFFETTQSLSRVHFSSFPLGIFCLCYHPRPVQEYAMIPSSSLPTIHPFPKSDLPFPRRSLLPWYLAPSWLLIQLNKRFQLKLFGVRPCTARSPNGICALLLSCPPVTVDDCKKERGKRKRKIADMKIQWGLAPIQAVDSFLPHDADVLVYFPSAKGHV